jgi:hypothetical protein
MHFREVVIRCSSTVLSQEESSVNRQNARAWCGGGRGGKGDGRAWKTFQHRSMFIDVKSTSSMLTWLLFPKAAGKGLGPMGVTSRQRRPSLRAEQTHCGIAGDFGNHHEGGERLVGLTVRVVVVGEPVKR